MDATVFAGSPTLLESHLGLSARKMTRDPGANREKGDEASSGRGAGPMEPSSREGGAPVRRGVETITRPAQEMSDDHQLARAAATGDETAFEDLVRRHTPAVWRMARSMLRDDFAAEEAVQDTFLKAHRHLDGFRGEAKVSTWLLSICHRACLDRLRLRRVETVPFEDLSGEAGRHETPELKVALERALETLPHEEREAFVLVAVAGHTRDEAAEIVGVPASTMRSRMSRAREKLARALGEARREAAGG